MPKRILVVCVKGSSRALLAASLLHALDSDHLWEVWSALPDDQQGNAFVEQVLREQGRTMLSDEWWVVPTSELVWDEVILLCSGATDT
jgi:protein-tyrosine-phosphatase